MKILNCFYGQVRKMGEDMSAFQLPNNLSTVITEQQVYTWDNATGMNPCQDYLPNPIKFSYGEMLEHTYNMGINTVVDLIEKMSSEEYEDKIKEDYKNNYTGLCKMLGQHWHIQHILNDNCDLDYNYIIIRQTDTFFHHSLTVEMLIDRLTLDPYRHISPARRKTIPIVYLLEQTCPVNWFDSPLMQSSLCYIFNKAAVIKLKENYYRLMMKVFDYNYKLLGKFNSRLIGQPAIPFVQFAVKNDIELLTIPRKWVKITPDSRRPTPDYSSLVRSGRWSDR